MHCQQATKCMSSLHPTKVGSRCLESGRLRDIALESLCLEAMSMCMGASPIPSVSSTLQFISRHEETCNSDRDSHDPSFLIKSSDVIAQVEVESNFGRTVRSLHIAFQLCRSHFYVYTMLYYAYASQKIAIKLCHIYCSTEYYSADSSKTVTAPIHVVMPSQTVQEQVSLQPKRLPAEFSICTRPQRDHR